VKKKIVLFSSDLKYEGLPLSLLHVTALLDKTRYGIKIITAVEYPGTYKNEILKQCKEAVCFGVSCYMGEPIINAVEVSRAVKQVYPSLPVIWGGELTATLPDKILESDYVDYLCRGQGERTFYEFVDMIETDDFKNISRIRGLSYKENGVNVHNPKREPEDLDSFPDFDLDLINLEKYREQSFYGEKSFRVNTSYGCLNRCGFCYTVNSSGGKWRTRSAERIIKFLVKLRGKTDFDSLLISDNNFFEDEERVAEFCRGLIKNGFNIRYGAANGTAYVLSKYSEATWKLMKESGLRRIMIGAESADRATLKFINKPGTPEDIYKAAAVCSKYGIRAVIFTMIGLPLPSYQAKKKKHVFYSELKKLNSFRKNIYAVSPEHLVLMYFYFPWPGTPLFRKALDLGLAPPEGLEGWAACDFYSNNLPWLPENSVKKLRVFNFVSEILNRDTAHFAPLPPVSRAFSVLIAKSAQYMARLRLRYDFYHFPIESPVYRYALYLYTH